MGSFNGELTRVSGYLANPIPSPMRAPHQAGEPKSGEDPNISDSRSRNSPAPEIT